MGWIIYDKTGEIERCTIKELEYNGSFMGERTVTCSFESPSVINFAIGDHITYRGEEFYLDYDPSQTKSASFGSALNAFKYDLIFRTIDIELQNCQLLDYVPYGNDYHYQPSPSFSFVGTAKTLAERIQANMNRDYPGWEIEVYDGVETEDAEIEIDNVSCWNALVMINKKFGLNFFISKRNVKIGYPEESLDHTFYYGKNNGLYQIERDVNADEVVVTRLYAYGGERNIPDDYNKRDSDFSGKKNLMLPGYLETGKNYIESKNISAYGIRECTMVFEDIYPSIAGVELPDIGRIDELVAAEQITKETETKGTFKITIKNIGFNIKDYLTTETATISMKSGSLIGYEFEIVDVVQLESGNYDITLNKSTRDDFQVPNAGQNLSAGDRFVILNIKMPEKYVEYAEDRLLKAATSCLAKHDHVFYTYNIGVDEIYMARNGNLHDLIREGMKLPLYDVDFGTDYSIIIQSLSIREGESIPAYDISLSDKPIASTIDKIWDAIDNVRNEGSTSTGGSIIGGGASPEELNKKYLRKDKPDQTNYLLGLNNGATFGTYVGGFLGSGGKFDKNGDIEGNSLTLREFLEVPELRFNRIDVVSGELWNSIAFGLIESVDTENQIVTLKLEEGELSGLHINDFCRGIFHNLTGNEAVSGTDSAGFDTIAGFSTSYFTPVKIIDNAHFKYELKPGTSVHPTASMKFSVYGNATDKSRQASAYSTRKYKRYLINVDTWEINPSKNITYQDGDLSNLVINGESLAKGSVYLNNVYFGGNVWNVPGLDNNFKGDDAYSAVLSTYSAVYNIADGIYSQVEVVTGDDTVMTGSDIVVASEFSVSTIIQAYKGANKLRYSDVVGEGKYLVTSEGEGCKYTITDGLVAVQEVTEDKATINLHVNCEGMSTFDLLFTITRVKNGEDGTDYEYIYTRTGSSSIPSTPSSKQEDDYVPTGWTDDPVGPTPSLPYEWVSKREKFHDVWGEYSTPALWAKYSFDGEDGGPGNPGEDGKTTYQVYRRSGSQPSTPTGTWVPPSGWALDPPVGDSPLWMSRAIFNGNGTIYSSWSTPVRITGDTGSPGSNGPALTFRGEYSGSKQYTGTSDHVEVVYTGSGSSRRYFITKTTAGTFTGQYPGNDTSYWKAFQGQFENIATGLLFAEEANIAGWWFSNTHIESQNRNVSIDGNADNGPRIALGASYSNRKEAPTRLYGDGTINTKMLIADDGCKIGNFSIENNWLKCNKDIGGETGYITMKGTNTEISFGQDLIPSTVGGAFTLTSIIKNRKKNYLSSSNLFNWDPEGNKNVGLNINTGNCDFPIAIDSEGFNSFKGGLSVVTYIPSSGYRWNDLKYKDIFVFQGSTSATSVITLPTKQELFDAFGGSDYFSNGLALSYQAVIKFTFLITRYSGKVAFRGVSGIPIIGTAGSIYGSGNYTYGQYEATPGTIVTFYYYNNNYYINSNAF